MVSAAELRKKFPGKKGASEKMKARHIAKEAIRREFMRQKGQLKGPPVFKRGVGFYGAILIGMLIVGAMVLRATDKHEAKNADAKMHEARKSLDNLSIALGRYKFHVGEYPSTEMGLHALTNLLVFTEGWNGPYIRAPREGLATPGKKAKKRKSMFEDPWGNEYVYSRREEGGYPVLYSRGPDGKMGTSDDVMPITQLFDEPFRDTTWTNKWAPHHYRDVLVAPDEASKKLWLEEMRTRNYQPSPLLKEKNK